MNRAVSLPSLHARSPGPLPRNPLLSPVKPLHATNPTTPAATSYTNYQVTKKLSRLPSGATGRGTSVASMSTKRRPQRTGGSLTAVQSVPQLVPTPVKVTKKLVKPKGETRQVELRGEVRKLKALTAGVQSQFPNAMPLSVFMEEIKRCLAQFGFHGHNSLAVVGLTRDEAARPLLNAISEVYGEPYVTHSLGAMCNVGREGMRQILGHAPKAVSNMRTKIIIFTAPNVACNQDGDTGVFYRPNLPEATVTSWELSTFVKQFRRGTFNLHKSQRIGFEPGDEIDSDMLDPDDIEMSVLNMKLSNQLIRDGGMNDTTLTGVTKAAARAALHDYERMIDKFVDLEHCDVAVVSCVQVHGQYQDMGAADYLKYETEFVALREGYVLDKGEKVGFGKVEGMMALQINGAGIELDSTNRFS